MSAGGSRRDFLNMGLGATVLAALKGLAGPAAARTADTRPNILFFITDDQSWLHIGYAGDPIVKTPHLDRLARGGDVFMEYAKTYHPGLNGANRGR